MNDSILCKFSLIIRIIFKIFTIDGRYDSQYLNLSSHLRKYTGDVLPLHHIPRSHFSFTLIEMWKLKSLYIYIVIKNSIIKIKIYLLNEYNCGINELFFKKMKIQ